MQQMQFKLRPEGRLNKDFPWQIFATGWVAIAKAVAWMFSEIAIPGTELILAQYLVFSVIFIILGIGAWNMKKWAQIGLIVFSVADLFLFFFFNYYAVLQLAPESLVFTQFFMLLSGPVGDLALIFLVLSASRYFGKSYPFDPAR